jgi:hypothetical protein
MTDIIRQARLPLIDSLLIIVLTAASLQSTLWGTFGGGTAWDVLFGSIYSACAVFLILLYLDEPARVPAVG